MGSVLLTPPHHSWLFCSVVLTLFTADTLRPAMGKRFLLQGDGFPGWKESVHSIILPAFFFRRLLPSFFLILLNLSNTLVHKQYNSTLSVTTLRQTLNSYLSHVYTNTSAAAAFTYSNVFSLAACCCCVKQHACICFPHATADLARYRYPSHLSLSDLFSLADSDEACPCHQHCWSCLSSWQGLGWSWNFPRSPALLPPSPPCPCKAATVSVCSV